MSKPITLSDLATHNRAMMAALDPRGGWSLFNDAWLAFRGTTADTEPGLADGAIHPEDRDQAQHLLRLALENRSPLLRRYRLLRHDGLYRWIEERGEPLPTDDGALRGMALQALDVTDHLETIAQLQESQSLYRQMFRNNRAVKLLIDPESGAIVDANEAASAYYGYPRDRLLQLKISDIDTLPPDEIAEEMRRAEHQERTYFRFRHRLASGELRDVEVYSGPVESPGKPCCFRSSTTSPNAIGPNAISNCARINCAP